MAGCGSGCPWFGDSWLLSLIEWATSDCSAFFENENERVGTFASFSLHYQNGWRMLLFGMLGSVFGEGGPWVSGTTPGMIQWNDLVYINIVGSRRRFCQILSTAPFLQKCISCSIFNRSPFLFAKVFHILRKLSSYSTHAPPQQKEHGTSNKKHSFWRRKLTHPEN